MAQKGESVPVQPLQIPSHAPEAWIDELADQVEIQRLCSMKVLVRADEYQGDVSGKLTTCFVRDWRLKPYGEQKTLRWMRRSRFVAREFANDKRLDTFSPATGAHTANLLSIQYLWQKQEEMEMENKGDYEVWVVWIWKTKVTMRYGLFGCEGCFSSGGAAEPHCGISSKPTFCDLA